MHQSIVLKLIGIIVWLVVTSLTSHFVTGQSRHITSRHGSVTALVRTPWASPHVPAVTERRSTVGELPGAPLPNSAAAAGGAWGRPRPRRHATSRRQGGTVPGGTVGASCLVTGLGREGTMAEML